MTIDHAAAAWETLAAIRNATPLVHNITNYVSMDVVANALLAAGASPVMAHAREEVDDIVAMAGALVVNIGTLDTHWVASMHAAASRARGLGVPWVLDPVGAGATRYRTRTALALCEHGPTVIRGNASEILALAGETGATRGVDSTRGSLEARDAAAALARARRCIVAATGAVDYITDGEQELAVSNGHPLMRQVTALGCAASGLVGAATAVRRDAPLEATAHALAVFGLAGEMAAREAAGPGSLRWRLLDALHALDELPVRDGVRIA